MSEQLVIDPARFARERGRLTGALTSAALPRLADQLHGAGGSIAYLVEGFISERGDPALRVELDGEVELRCQRCLETLRTRVDSRRELVLVQGADEFAQRSDEDETMDIIPAVPRLDLRTLLEDEVLLGLPVAPCHPPGECSAPEGQHASTPERISPFAALARLKR